MTSLPSSESGLRWVGADRSLEKMEMTANFWREGCGTRVFSRRGVYDSIDPRRETSGAAKVQVHARVRTSHRYGGP